MSRYTGPSWKKSRRYGISLTGSGKEIARRNYVPGQHGPNNRSKHRKNTVAAAWTQSTGKPVR